MLRERGGQALLALRGRIGWRPYPPSDDVACALCGSRDAVIVGRRVQFGMRYRTLLCTGCGLVYLSPRPSAASFARFYSGRYQQLYGRGEADEAPTSRGEAVASFLAVHVDTSRHSGVFDIGCAGGGLLRALARHPTFDGLPLGGCDPQWDRDTYLDEDGTQIAIHAAPVEDLEDELAQYSLFVSYDVVEHLLEPRMFLRRLHESTRGGAQLFISTNCIDNWAAIPPAGWETYYLRLAHPFTFSTRTLEALLVSEGWAVVAREPAPKGDQWVLATRAAPAPAAAHALTDHVGEVRAMIDEYRGRS
jgi:methyltransferase family protein